MGRERYPREASFLTLDEVEGTFESVARIVASVEGQSAESYAGKDLWIIVDPFDGIQHRF